MKKLLLMISVASMFCAKSQQPCETHTIGITSTIPGQNPQITSFVFLCTKEKAIQLVAYGGEPLGTSNYVWSNGITAQSVYQNIQGYQNNLALSTGLNSVSATAEFIEFGRTCYTTCTIKISVCVPDLVRYTLYECQGKTLYDFYGALATPLVGSLLIEALESGPVRVLVIE